ncbi:MAG: type II toxin-antitoxin system PemK/MazF family toxin [Bacteroidota bacterium]|nr:type II toxin-antitoxin system PemK/MazF family toxin [Bacteroidota bacterium]MDP4230879.1 type II toxin-antitoxin system PemK/MazF family toxin [Bacteroidota bacterium]MDP4237033.1 type II toxin-antitoxin system PemK/MazF family toxin [Bacteroidota bacterium]
MPEYSFGDVVVLPFSYTDLRSEKRRPALVILDSDDGDLLVARITSKSYGSLFDVPIIHWDKVGLLIQSYVRLHKLVTIEKNHVLKRLGQIDATDLARIKVAFGSIIK